MHAQPAATPPTPPPRPPAAVRAERDEVRRHLVEAPPHHASGVREALQRRLQVLERELARIAASDESVR